MSSVIKNIAVLIGIVVLGLLAFWYLSRAPQESAFDHIKAGVAATGGSSNPADEFALLLDQLSGVDFQRGNTIFTNPVFRNGLVSFRRELPQIDRARNNPFAPLEGAPASYIRYSKPLPNALVPAATSSFPSATSTN